jgi:hypothetical protein
MAIICYLRGTLILTTSGERFVENLAIGESIVTRFGGVQRIKWIGRQNFGARLIADNPGKQPVCISAGALGENTQRRDLFVSPGPSRCNRCARANGRRRRSPYR